MATLIVRMDDEVIKIDGNEFSIVQIAIENKSGMGYLIDDSILDTVPFEEEFANLRRNTHYTFELRNGESLFIKCNGTGALILNEGTIVVV